MRLPLSQRARGVFTALIPLLLASTGGCLEADPEHGEAAEPSHLPSERSPLLEGERCVTPEPSQPMTAALVYREPPPPPPPPPPRPIPAVANNAASGGVGSHTTAKTKFFGIEGRGHRFVYVIDRSGSMSGDALQAAKAEVKRSLNGLTPQEEFLVLFFDDQPLVMPGDALMQGSRANIDRINEWIDGVDSLGGTDPIPAIEKALNVKPDAVWLLADGGFDTREIVEHWRSSQSQAMIHTIAYWEEQTKAEMKAIATATGGQFRFVPNPSN